MKSRSAAQVSERRVQRLAALSPADRVRLAQRLGAEGIAAYMAAHGVDRATALARIKATRRLGRRPSRCADER